MFISSLAQACLANKSALTVAHLRSIVCGRRERREREKEKERKRERERKIEKEREREKERGEMRSIVRTLFVYRD